MDWFSLCLDGFTIAAQGILHMAFLCRLTGRRPGACCFAAYLLLLCGIQTICSAAGWGALPALAAELLALYVVSCLGLKNRPAQSWTAAVLAVYIFQLACGVVNSMEVLVIPGLEEGGRALYAMVSAAALSAPALCAAVYGLVLRVLSLREDALYRGLLMLPGLFFFTAELYILETAYSSIPMVPEAPGKHLALFSLQTLGLAALLCTLYAYRRACRGVRAQAALDSLARSVQAQKRCADEAQAREEKTKSFRHDLQNHLSVLDGLLRDRRTEEARSYLQKLEAAASALSPPCRTGDPAVDALLGEKLALAESRGINAWVAVRLPEGVDGFILCVIFANALDNALTACEAVEEGAFLRVWDRRQGDLYCLFFENSCVPGPAPRPGTGLANIRAAAEKYRGAAEFRRTGERFRLDVLLNISGQPEDHSAQKPCGLF